jgi:hypothetical protein
MTETEEKELVEWLAMMFAMLADGRLWDDLTQRSRFNDFNWEERPWLNLEMQLSRWKVAS